MDDNTRTPPIVDLSPGKALQWSDLKWGNLANPIAIEGRGPTNTNMAFVPPPPEPHEHP